MEVHQLRYFVAVADEGSFSRAAAREHVAQPSLSQQIQKLEAEMDQRLFDRLPRSVVVTEAGKCLLEYARKILVEIADARRCVDELKREVVGRLAVGAIPTIAPYVLPALIEKFQRRYPKVTLEIFEDTTERLVRRMEDGEVDIALVSTCDESPDLERHSLGKEALLVLLPKGHQLAKKKKIKWSDLKSQKFLLLHELHCLSAQVYQFLVTHHLRPELAVRGAQLGTIEVWELVNITNELHNFHIHQTKFRLARAGDPGVASTLSMATAFQDPGRALLVPIGCYQHPIGIGAAQTAECPRGVARERPLVGRNATRKG